MSLIIKSQIAAVLGINDADIASNVYNIAKKQLFILTGVKEIETEKTFTKFVGQATGWISLPDKNIESIDAISLDDVEVEVTVTSVKFNPESGLVYYSGGFSGKVYIEYTISAYTVDALHDYILTLLVVKQLSLFTPNILEQVSSFKIGQFSKNFGSAARSQDDFIANLDLAIKQAVNMSLGDNGQLEIGGVI